MTAAPSASEPDGRRVLLVHGRDGEARRAMADLLRALDLQPMEWGQLVQLAGRGSPYNGEVVAVALEHVQATVVLCTPDEITQLHPALGSEDDEDRALQPRPNVILEAGMALARMPSRTVFVEVGSTRGISDLDGRNVVRLSSKGGVNPLNDLATRLERAGCPINRAGSDWLDHERFSTLAAFSRTVDSAEASAPPAPADLELASASHELAGDIHSFLGDRERDDPTREPHWRRYVPGMTEEEKSAIFHEESTKMIDYSRETMRRFAQRYQAKALAHFESLVQLGLLDERDRHVFEYPTNPLGIAEVATRLGVAAERLR